MRKIDYSDPVKALDWHRRRTIGCFSCANSKYEKVGETMKSFCAIKVLEPELNYPDENRDSCKYYVRRK